MTPLVQPNSPLAQVQRAAGRVAIAPSRKRLSPADEAELRRVLTEKYEYVDHEDFHLHPDEAHRVVFEEPDPLPQPDTSWYHPVMDKGYSDMRANKHVKSALLTAKQERVIFKQFNYARMRVCELRDDLADAASIDAEDARDLLRWHRKAEGLRHQIARLNLALVLAMAKRTRMSEVDFADLVSEGNMALLRAVDKFDVSRGFKFSTYGCRAILKAFSRSGMKLTRYRQMFPTDFDPALERSTHMQTKRAEHEDDCVDELRQIIRQNRADLSDIESEVISHRFAIDKPTEKGEDPKPLTLEQVGRIIGVTKERVRQIQNKALEKIRVQLEDDFLV